MNATGNFGVNAEHYVRGRKNFPAELISGLHALLRSSATPKILDVGCGTGIATRQMYSFATVIGLDADAEMLSAALSSDPKPIYMKGSAESLPFIDGQFDCVTAFSSFHWFATLSVVREIRRVLKPGGVFFVVNKTGTRQPKAVYKRILSGFIEGSIPNVKKNYRPKGQIELAGFHDVKKYTLVEEEHYTTEEAMHYLQSVSLFGHIRKERQTEAKTRLRAYVEAASVDGVFTRTVRFGIVYGYAP